MPRNFVLHSQKTREKIRKSMNEKYIGKTYPKKNLTCYHCNECNLSRYMFLKSHQGQCLFKEEEEKITKNEYQKEYQKKYREKNKEKKRIYQYNYYRNLI